MLVCVCWGVGGWESKELDDNDIHFHPQSTLKFKFLIWKHFG